MTPRIALALGAALLLAACDSTTRIDGADGVFRTEGTDYPSAAVALAGSEIVVGALVQGTVAPADGTVGYPAVVRFSNEDVEAAVYDDNGRDYAGVNGVAALNDGLALAIAENGEVAVYAADRTGRSRDLVLRLDRAASLPEDALVATPGGLVLAVHPRTADAPQLYGVSASGQLRWSYRIPGAQDVQAVSVAPDGDLYVAAVGFENAVGRTIIERLSPDGDVRWRVTRPSSSSNESSYPVDLAATGDGVALVFREVYGPRFEAGSGSLATVLCLDGGGGEVWSRTLRAAGTDTLDSDLLPTRLAVVSGGAVVVAATVGDGDIETGNAAVLVALNADGTERGRQTLGDPAESTIRVQGLLPLPGNRFGVVLAVGPARSGGYGGDDFDIEVVRLDLDGFSMED